MKKILIAVLMVCVAATLFAVGGQEDVGEPVEIKFPHYWVGTKAEAPYMSGFIARFTATYPNINLSVEEVAGETNYFEKMQVLLSADDLPDIIWNTGNNFIDMGVEAGALVNFTPHLDADPDWRAYFPVQDLEFNSRNGGVYALQDRMGMIGYFYNKEHFANAGVAGPAKTWPEFWQTAEKIIT